MHRTSAIIGILLFPLPALAQPDPLRTAELPFLDKSANHIVHRGDSSGFATWHAKLDRLLLEGEGQLNVVHIGGSHIQADMWSMQVRHRMQHVVPGVRAGRGFIFPFTMAKTNNPWSYEVKHTGNWTAVRNVTRTDTSTLGLSGISVTTRDTLTNLTVSFRGDHYPGYPFNRIKVLHNRDSSFAVEAWSRDSTVIIDHSRDAAQGITTIQYSRYMDTLRLRFRRADTLQSRFTLHGIILESDDPGVLYHAIGVNGASTKSYLRCQRFVDHLALVKPDLVVFSVGINDAHDSEFDPKRFKRNYTDLIARVRQANPDAAILLTTNSDSYFKRKVANRNAHKVRDVMLELSAEQGVAVWDLFTVMGGLGSIAKWEAAGLAQKDRIHFNRQGYMLLGDLQVAALMEAYGRHVKLSARP
jgi:lysophospholipase L1-like esterase